MSLPGTARTEGQDRSGRGGLGVKSFPNHRISLSELGRSKVRSASRCRGTGWIEAAKGDGEWCQEPLLSLNPWNTRQEPWEHKAGALGTQGRNLWNIRNPVGSDHAVQEPLAFPVVPGESTSCMFGV